MSALKNILDLIMAVEKLLAAIDQDGAVIDLEILQLKRALKKVKG